MIDDEILLGCKCPDDESSSDLRPVTYLGLGQNRLSVDITTNGTQKDPPRIPTGDFYITTRGRKSFETRTHPCMSRVLPKQKPPMVILSQEA